jgi:hypothetical protein
MSGGIYVDRFGPHTAYSGGAAVVLSDAADLAGGRIARGFMVATAGAVRVTTLDGDTITLPACQPGVVYNVQVKRFWVTGTVPATVVALW